jgi:hypothetical protein
VGVDVGCFGFPSCSVRLAGFCSSESGLVSDDKYTFSVLETMKWASADYLNSISRVLNFSLISKEVENVVY